MPGEPLQLRYADREQQYGVVLERWPAGLRITIPHASDGSHRP